jgi:hypothetical protein
MAKENQQPNYEILINNMIGSLDIITTSQSSQPSL